jgi:hypothetical protein
MPPYTRTKIWQAVSVIEAIKDWDDNVGNGLILKP